MSQVVSLADQAVSFSYGIEGMPKERSDLVCFWAFMVVLSKRGEAGSCSSMSVIVCYLLSAFLSRPCLCRSLYL